MNRLILESMRDHWFAPKESWFIEIDRALRSERGPQPTLSVRVPLGGMEYLANARGSKTLSLLHETLAYDARPEELRLFFGTPDGAPDPLPPTLWQLYHTWERLCTCLKGEDPRFGRRTQRLWHTLGADDRTGAGLAFQAHLLQGTYPELPAGAVMAVDGTKIPAACRPKSQRKIRAGDYASDKDARWRKYDTRRKRRGQPEAAASEPSTDDRETGDGEHWLGYRSVAYTMTGKGQEYVYGQWTLPADQGEPETSITLLDLMQRGGISPSAVVADLGFSLSGPWLDGMRNRGVMPHFYLSAEDRAQEPSWRGTLVLQGWPYLPQLPSGLREVARPEPGSPDAEWDAYEKLCGDRDVYAFLRKGKGTPQSVRVQSPLFRGRKLGCPLVPGSMEKRGAAFAACAGNHGLDEACCIQEGTFKAKYARYSFQDPHIGSKDYEKVIDRRSTIERSNSIFKNQDIVGMDRSHFRMRGLEQVGILAALAWGAHNLHLRRLNAKYPLIDGRRHPRRQRKDPIPIAA